MLILCMYYVCRGLPGNISEIEDSGYHNLTNRQHHHPNSWGQVIDEFRTKFEDEDDYLWLL